jgi:uncharacterized repeat protein (TIGR01451 family)
VGLALLAAGSPASAAPQSAAAPARTAVPAALNDSGPFAASAQASLLTLDVPSLSPALLPQTNIDLAPSAAQADSDADLDADKPGGQRTAAIAGTTFGSIVLGTALDIQTNGASAPASEANEATLIPLDLAPLLDLPIINTAAAANWVSDTECVAPGTPLSAANQNLADLTLLEPVPGQSVVNLDTDAGDGAADSQVATYLASIDGPGDARAVQAHATTDISSANVLNGLAGPGSVIQADVVQAPSVVASASGLPGGASVTGDRPVVEVNIAGEPLITLDANNPTAEATITDLVLGDLLELPDSAGLLSGPDGLLADLGLDALIPVVAPVEDAVSTALNELQPVVRVSIPYTENVAANGTSASVEGALLRVEVLPPAALGAAEPLADVLNQILGALGLDITEPLVFLELAPYAASVTAPAGGIDCDGDNENPLRELNKHASAAEVAPGATFDYNISVPNRGPCALTDVIVVDTVSGPGSIVSTEPAGTINGNTVTFDVGDLAVNETVNLRITVRVDEDAPNGATFDDVVNATGNCDGRPVEQDDTLDDIPTVSDFDGPCSVQFSNKDASHKLVTEGQTFSYYIHVFNSGAEPCTDVVITDTLDERLDFVGCDLGCDNEGQDVTWTLDSVGGGSSTVLSVIVQVRDGAEGVLENTAVIDPGNGDPKTVHKDGPPIGDESVINDPISPRRGPSGPLAATGAGMPLALASILGVGALALLAVRRRSTLA